MSSDFVASPALPLFRSVGLLKWLVGLYCHVATLGNVWPRGPRTGAERDSGQGTGDAGRGQSDPPVVPPLVWRRQFIDGRSVPSRSPLAALSEPHLIIITHATLRQRGNDTQLPNKPRARTAQLLSRLAWSGLRRLDAGRHYQRH